MPKVSVIIPVHNAERFLRECVDSVLAQTLADIEVFCVDDGSTDGSRAVLDEYARTDSRVTVLAQSNAGAGAARNAAMVRATGEYLSFLDADDLFEPRMLERALAKCSADRADVCVYGARLLDTDSGRVSNADNLLRTGLLPGTVPFSYKDISDHILDFTSPAPWNKLFRREFIAEQGLRFQELKRANDFYFTKLATVKAQRITVLDEYLVYYRVGGQSNLQSNNDETPLVFHDAHVALRQGLIEAGVFSAVERGFVNLVLANCLYNLHSLKTAGSFNLLYYKMRDAYFPQMGVDGHDSDYFFSQRQYEQYVKIKELPPEGYLLDELQVLRAHSKATSERLTTAEKKLRQIKASSSYKMGRAITYLPRKLKSASKPRRKGQ